MTAKKITTNEQNMDTYDELHAVATNHKHRVSKNSERNKFPADFQDCWTGHPEASR